jgi:FlgD Ig-like domain
MKCGKSFFPLIVSVIFSGLYSNVFGADQSCSMKLGSCPESYNGQAVYVPRSVNVISPDFKVCMPSLPDEGVTGTYETPSIMFIIDNSTSMMGSASVTKPRDSGGVRFKVVSALLDTIFKQFPGADVGLTVFKDYLYFDARSNPNFAVFPEEYYTRYPFSATVSENYKNQAYIPLLRLDSTVQGGVKAIDLFKEMLLTKRELVTGGRYETTVMQYTPGFTATSGTNINAAFDATTYAMTKAKNGPDAQFVIFLSDGVPNANNWPRTDDDYMNGWGMPTTFTVYFTDVGEADAPAGIQTMTTNIKNGDYSKSNVLSAYYPMNVSYDTLMSVLINKALKPIMSSLKKEPTALKLNNKTYTRYNVTDSTFAIDAIPLKDSITHIEMEINYQVKVADSSKVLRDTIVKSVFDIIRSDKISPDPNVLINCHDTILYNVSITASDREAAEAGPDNGSFQITRTNSGLGDLTVYYTVKGTASKGTDYTADTLSDSVKFVSGISSKTILIKPITDTIKEGDETVVIKLLTQKNNRNIRYAINGTDSAVVVIKDLVIIKEDTLEIAVLLNPFSRTVPILQQLDSLPESIKKSEMFGKLQQLIGDNNSGTILAVKTTTHKGTPISGKAVLYDALGNVVKKLEIGEIDKSKGDYGAFWDGTNVNNRKVGAGVYLMKVYIEGEKMKSIKVGVRE